jgi:hypothetical protein
VVIYEALSVCRKATKFFRELAASRSWNPRLRRMVM